MDDKARVAKHESLPQYPLQGKEESDSIFLSSATHPSVRSRNPTDIFKRLRSGDDVLSRLPTHLDPNLQFSEDEDEEEQPQENKETSDVENTPDFRHNSMELPRNIYMKQMSSTSRNRPTFPAMNPFYRQTLTAQKPPASARNFKVAAPQSERRVKSSTALSDIKPKMNLNQPAFKVPVSKPIVPLPMDPIANQNLSHYQPKNLTEETIEVNGKSYGVLSLLGSGGSCKVYSAFDKKDLVAIKCVDLKGTDPSIREGYKKEIEYLQQLQGSNRVIKMYDFEYRQNELFLVLERGDIDFAKYISNEAKLKRLSPLMIKFYWAQMLEAVADIHKYGIVHSDLKPANFLLVAGNLKLIDFGIATSVPDDKTSAFRDTQVGTLNYMSPEAVTQQSTSDSAQICFKVGVKSDVWSLGCILYNLVYGVTPFQHIRTLLQKIQAIVNPNFEIEFKPHKDKLVVDVLKKCLKRNPKERASVDELLQHPYLTEDKVPSANAGNSPPTASAVADLSNVMAQMQGLTPRRMSYLTKVVKELTENHI